MVAAFCVLSHKPFLYRANTGVPVYVPIPPNVSRDSASDSSDNPTIRDYDFSC
jgi:hypothetical protein